MVLALVASAAQAVWADTPEELFDRGNTAYEAGRFRESAEAYRAALRYGVRDARLEYNLGNAEFKLGHLGRAILHFERARRLDPTDPDVKANLEWVRSFCVDQVEPAEAAGLVLWWRSVQDRIGPDRQALLALVLFWVIAGIVTWCAARPGGWAPAYGWLLACLVGLLVLAVVSWRSTDRRIEGRSIAVVLRPAVEVLAGPGLNNATLFTVHEGLTVEIRGDRGEWLQVSLPNGLNGWLPGETVERV